MMFPIGVLLDLRKKVMTKILYLIPDMQVGGIETLLLRMSKSPLAKDWIFWHMHAVKHEYALQREFEKTDAFIIKNMDIRRLMFGFDKKSLKKLIQDRQLDQVEVIYCFHLLGSIYANYLKKYYFPHVKIIIGVYHPKEYAWTSGGKFSQLEITARMLIGSSPTKNIIFMNSGMKKSHEYYLQKDLACSPVFPVMIDAMRFNNIQRAPEQFKIVSVGRICNFKTYNFAMIAVIKKLHTMDKRYTYHIYGSGDMEDYLFKLIADHNAQDCVFFHGTIPYEKFPDILADAFIFVGGGTAIVEAAAAGVPSLCVIMSEMKPETYGWFHQSDDDNLGEIDRRKPRYQYFDLISDLANHPDLYAEYSRQSKEKASMYSLQNNLPKFIELLNAGEQSEMHFSYKMLLSLVTAKFFNTIDRLGYYSSYKDRYR